MRDHLLKEVATSHGLDVDAPLLIGGNYTPVLQHAGVVYISGQIPRVGATVTVIGAAGREVDLHGAQLAARICALRAVILLYQELGTLDRVEKILKLNVFVQSAPDFTLQSEVANGASDLLELIFGASCLHTRTSVGVIQLPKNATVEVDLIAAI
ncbi:RidA family protein [Leeia sp. TBRC 13508]|uniref:RidA family protein n=1 Tax=Leeia speluncae TaxID=2884804 RepID=A0ABS8D346_9NEIS|nr:RidA family protein [Leeia speluncae]MCB6182624.1 RidA family protein [Leeia speluncae]